MSLAWAAPPAAPVARRWVVAAMIGAGATGLLAWGYPLSQFDGGIVASAATFTLHGLLPYRDYWLLYGPLPGLFLSIPVAILGPSIDVLRGAGLFVVLAQAGFGTLLVARGAYPFGAGLIAVAAVIATPLLMGLEVSAWSIAMLLALIALYVHNAGWPPLAVGLLVGATFLTRLDVGGYLLAALLVTARSRALVLGFAAPVVPIAVVLIVVVPIDALFEQLIWYPIVGPRQFRGLPGLDASVSGVGSILFAIPLLIVPRMAIALNLWRGLRARSTLGLEMGLFAGLCQLQTLGRSDLDHFAMASTPAILLLGPIVTRRAWSNIVVILIVGGVAAASLAGAHWRMLASRSADEGLRAASELARSITAESDRIFVGLTSNSYTIANPTIGYFLADRAAGTSMTMYNPGITNTDERQQRMVVELVAADTDVALLSEVWAGAYEPWNDSRVRGSSILDHYLSSHFRTLCQFETVRVSVRTSARNLPSTCPIADFGP